MADHSGIEWTEATWNPSTGCTKVSEGCRNCYAETMAARLREMGQPKYRNGFRFAQHESELDRPMRWRRPRRVFVDSMSDLFHHSMEESFLARCFETMLRANHHTYQILTKRPGTMRVFSERFERHFGVPIPAHIWMGTSVETDDVAWRIKELVGVKCVTRFVSFEPLLGDIAAPLYDIDWAIVGGESGPNHRPVREEWVRNLVRRCVDRSIPVFFKQWGGPSPKSGGRTLDGRTYDEYPDTIRDHAANHAIAEKLAAGWPWSG